MARMALARDFRNIDPRSARIVLFEAAPRILPGYPAQLSARAHHHLEQLGVQVRPGTKVEDVDASGVVVAGQRIGSRTVLWTAGVVASPAGQWLGVETDRAGRVKVQTDLAAPHVRRAARPATLSRLSARGPVAPAGDRLREDRQLCRDREGGWQPEGGSRCGQRMRQQPPARRGALPPRRAERRNDRTVRRWRRRQASSAHARGIGVTARTYTRSATSGEAFRASRIIQS